MNSLKKSTLCKATFAGGCFWCLQPVFDPIPGVISTTVGYIGGKTENPTYEDVCSGKTGHAEAIEVTFDPEVVDYQTLLHLFWRNIDPTVLNRQFCDVGTQYRTAIFYHNANQKMIAEQSKRDVGLKHSVLTEIVPASQFYPAELYHQKYYQMQAAHYEAYHCHCGREERLKDLWG